MTDLLTQEEIGLVRRLLKDPAYFPKEFGPWVADYAQTNMGQIPFSSIVGTRGIPRFLTQDTESAAFIGSSSYVSMWSTTLPGKTLGRQGEMRIMFAYNTSCSDGSNGFQIRLYVGGIETTNVVVDQTLLDGSVRSGMFEFRFVNLGAYTKNGVFADGLYGVQVGGDHQISTWTSGATSLYDGSLDLSKDVTFELKIKWEGAGTQTFNKKYIGVQIFNPLGVAA
jgi:hypothetical protein